MLRPSFTGQFRRDLKRMKRQGRDPDELKKIMEQLISERPLAARHRDHKLVGRYRGRRECHIRPDWLLIYKVEGDSILFERTGTHSDLFKK